MATPVSQGVVGQPVQRSSKKAADGLQEQVEEAPVRQSARLYSPSMPYEALPQPKFNDTSAYSTRAEQAATVDELVSSISADMAGNTTREIFANPKPHANSLTGRSSALVSPAQLSTTPREGPRAVEINGKAADTSHANGVESRNSRIQADRNSLPGPTSSTTRTSSPPKAGKPVMLEKVGQRSHEGEMHSSPPSHGNGHVAQSSSISKGIKVHNPATKESSINGAHRGDKHNAPKYLSNGHGSASHGTRLMSEKVSISGDSARQTPQLPHSQELAITAEVSRNNLLQAATPGLAASQAVYPFTHQEAMQEPLGAHIVRVEALLRGALMELETLKRSIR